MYSTQSSTTVPAPLMTMSVLLLGLSNAFLSGFVKFNTGLLSIIFCIDSGRVQF